MKAATQEVRAISIRQPFADMIVFGPKWAENRTWNTKYRGPLFIHASRWEPNVEQETPGNGDVGALIGRVNLVDVVFLEAADGEAVLRQSAKQHGLSTKAASMEHAGGPVCLILAEPRALKVPVPFLGKLNIWKAEIPTDQLAFQRGAPKASGEWQAKPKRIAKIEIGGKASYKRRNYWVVEISEEIIGLAGKRGGPVVTWEDVGELEPRWYV